MVKKSDYKIATIGSHSALQILHGAHAEGFQTIAICKRGMARPYKMFNVADEIITVDSYKDIVSLQDELIERNAIVIPHASFITYVGYETVEGFKVHYFGNKHILKWESDRTLERKWLLQARLKLPRIYNLPSEIDKPVIVKFHGAD